MTALPKIEGRVWIGQNPTTLDNLSDKVVLVHFWTYSSPHCLRTLPYLREWHEKYMDDDFVVIGIHTPEFEFEQNPKNVENAIRELGISWPVLLDNERVNWDNFENDCWPALYLADKEGNLAYSHLGEGAYEGTTEKIRECLGLQGKDNGFAESHSHEKGCITPTPDVYCGYLRGNIANELSFTEEEEDSYVVSEDLREGDIALIGAFFSSSEYVESRENGAALSVSFHATEVHLVLAPGKDNAEIEVSLDGFSLPEEVKGRDVKVDSRVLVDHAGNYELLKSVEPISGVVKISAISGNFRAYVFSFSGCVQ